MFSSSSFQSDQAFSPLIDNILRLLNAPPVLDNKQFDLDFLVYIRVSRFRAQCNDMFARIEKMPRINGMIRVFYNGIHLIRPIHAYKLNTRWQLDSIKALQHTFRRSLSDEARIALADAIKWHGERAALLAVNRRTVH